MNASKFYDEGYRAFKNGRDLDNDCPYEEATEGFNKWREGWLDAAEAFDHWDINNEI